MHAKKLYFLKYVRTSLYKWYRTSEPESVIEETPCWRWWWRREPTITYCEGKASDRRRKTNKSKGSQQRRQNALSFANWFSFLPKGTFTCAQVSHSNEWIKLPSIFCSLFQSLFFTTDIKYLAHTCLWW